MQKWSEQGTIFLNIARLKFNTDGEKFLNFFLPVIGTYIRPLSRNEYHATPAETRQRRIQDRRPPPLLKKIKGLFL